MFPFDRLIQLMDGWAAANPKAQLLAQIGAGVYEPAHMPWVRKLDQAEFSRTVEAAELVVAHAGMGSVITASEFGRPIVMMPRLRERGEHTTEHQIATANWLRGKPGVFIADVDADLGPRIAEALKAGPPAEPTFAAEASTHFISLIRQCILGQS